MTDNPRTYQRNIKGQFAKVDPVRDVLAPDLGAPEKFAYGPYGAWVPPNARLRVEGDDAARVRHGIQGAHVRDAARKNRAPMDPSAFITGADDD